MMGKGGGTISVAGADVSGFIGGMSCPRKLRISFSSDDMRVTRSSTTRLTLFAFASATKGRTRIAITKPISIRIKSSMCCWGFGWMLRRLRKKIAALRGDCELIKMPDFIDVFDHEHSLPGAVLFRR